MGQIQKINIALLGCGRLGQGIFNLWQQRREKLIKETDIDSMAENMLTIKRLLAHNPKSLTIEDTKPLFNRMFEGTALPLSEY